MEKCTLVGSPNWYLSQVFDCAWDNKVAFGTLNSIVVLDPSNAENPKIIHQAHTGKITSISFSSKGGGNKLLSTGDTGEAFVWNLDTQKVALVYRNPNKCPVYGSWSHVDENLIVCVDESGSLMQWKVNSNVINGKAFKEHSFVVVSCCPHSRDLVATGTRQGLVCVINIKGKEFIVHKMRGHDSEVVSLSWCPVPENIFNMKNKQQCFLLASGARERKIFFWRAGTDGLYESFIETPSASRVQTVIKQWNSVCWFTPSQFLASTTQGEVLSTNLTKFNPKKGKENWTNFSQDHSRCHVIVKCSPWNSSVGSDNNDWRTEDTSPRWVWTFGADRIVAGVCSDKTVVPIKLNTIGGPIHAMAKSPIDGTSLAIGAADKTIRVVNLSEPQLKTMQTFNYKVSGKVMSLSWHPSKDGWLAYGTSDGRIGIQFTCTVKPPLLFRPFTKESIYAMEWGPSLASVKSNFESSEGEVTVKPSNHVLYAVGGGLIAIMDPNKPDHLFEEPFKTILKTILKPQSLKGKNKPLCLTDLAWKPDFSLLALGDEAGSIHLFNRSKEEELALVASFKVHSSLIQDISWHPHCCATDSTDVSAQANWLASASNDVNICILDVTSVLDVLQGPSDGNTLPISDVPCITTLKGHKARVAKVAWSPHEGGRLLSVSYDCCAQVWDVIKRQPIACYIHHNARLLTCEWSPFNPSLAITGGQEGILRIWDVQEQETKLPVAKNKEANNMLSCAKEVSSSIHGNQTDERCSAKTQLKKKEKTVLPLSGPEMQDDDNNYCILQRLLNPPVNEEVKISQDGFVIDGRSIPLHYAFFASQPGVIEQYLMMESKDAAIPENSFILNIWQGSIKDTITEAIQNKTLNSFMVSIAPTVSHKMWMDACAAYAEQLKDAGEHSKASAYLLATHKVEEAIQLLSEHGKYRHAVAVARCRLPQGSAILADLLLGWAQHSVLQGQQSLAAVCFASAGEWSKAAQCLIRKKTPMRLLMAARIMREKCPEDPTGAFYAHECLDIALPMKDWSSAHAALNLYPKLNYLALYLFVHESIHSFKDSFPPEEWLKLESNGNESEPGRETKENALNVTISFPDEKISALYKDMATEVSVTSEESAWLVASRKLTLAFLAAPSLFPRISCKFAIDKVATAEDVRSAHRFLVQALSTLYHFHITNRLNEKGIPTFFKFCIWLAPQGPFHADSIFASTSTPMQSSLRAYLAAGLLLWMAQSTITDSDVKCSAIQLIDNLKGDIFSIESLRSFKVDFKLKVLREKQLNRLVKEKQKCQDNDIESIGGQKQDENVISQDTYAKLESLHITDDDHSVRDNERISEDTEIDELNKWVQKFAESNENVPNPYLSYSNLVQYLNVNKEENGELLQKFAKFWELSNDTLSM